ncbi:MAG: PilZ domain-containing protein [Myxococcota bacterium]
MNGTQQRGTPRHQVEIPCAVVRSDRDEPDLFWATDLSSDGLWLEGAQDLALGHIVVACFDPGVWWRRREIHAFAEVVRRSRGQREGDTGSGAGLRFLDLSRGERWALRRWLHPRPLTSPIRRHLTSTWAAAARAGGATAFGAATAFGSPFATRVC